METQPDACENAAIRCGLAPSGSQKPAYNTTFVPLPAKPQEYRGNKPVYKAAVKYLLHLSVHTPAPGARLKTSRPLPLCVFLSHSTFNNQHSQRKQRSSSAVIVALNKRLMLRACPEEVMCAILVKRIVIFIR